jgi:hypothetical protein
VDPVSLALEIKRGALRLREVPLALQGTVKAVLNEMSDGQAATILHLREKRTQQHNRTTTKFRYAGS